MNNLIKATTKEEDLLFSDMVINSDVMQIIKILMKKKGIKNKAELAKELDVTKAYITKLFSGDKFFNVRLLTKFQNLFGVSFRLVTTEMIDEIQKTNQVYDFIVVDRYVSTLLKSSNSEATNQKKESTITASATEHQQMEVVELILN